MFDPGIDTALLCFDEFEIYLVSYIFEDELFYPLVLLVTSLSTPTGDFGLVTEGRLSLLSLESSTLLSLMPERLILLCMGSQAVVSSS